MAADRSGRFSTPTRCAGRNGEPVDGDHVSVAPVLRNGPTVGTDQRQHPPSGQQVTGAVVRERVVIPCAAGNDDGDLLAGTGAHADFGEKIGIAGEAPVDALVEDVRESTTALRDELEELPGYARDDDGEEDDDGEATPERRCARHAVRTLPCR